MTQQNRVPGWRARLASMGWDYLTIAAGLGVLTVAGFAVRPFLPQRTPGLAATDALAFGMTVLPTWVWLTASESGSAHATWGKRRAGLRVVNADDLARPVSVVQAGVRNAVKLLPWQIAHLAVSRFIVGQQIPLAISADLVSVGLAAGTCVAAARDPRRRALHDRLAGTAVVQTTSPPRRSS